MSLHQTDFPAGSLVKHRLFIALRPPAHALRRIASVEAGMTFSPRVADDRRHLTLFVSEDFENEPVDLIQAITAELDRVRIDAFDIALHRFGHLGTSLVSARAKPVRHFHAQIAQKLALAGIASRKDWAFNPHVTLGYGEAPERSGRVIAPIAWRADEFVLIHSLLRLTMHRTIGSWPLIEQPRLL
ncbi:2'-5' RNA ligase family protein [Sphingomonas sp. BIUV-7]|uniref:2'-5' RNA ligase family protein n=1 Tax=Sphingomonas natans TaxID=3063330 RepID=A0ABT8YCC0_9SPHN|nr:2'-5' RNA ligase family protein [Sphingomonas sp. BIUV-7]MDO6415969.1 2'-5' RNA ligase family protein [Sphingomonas sp. BIUV-7]